MSAFLLKEKVLSELDLAIKICMLHGEPTPNLQRLKQHIEEGRYDWTSEGD